jgi:hypothetical protein
MFYHQVNLDFLNPPTLWKPESVLTTTDDLFQDTGFKIPPTTGVC